MTILTGALVVAVFVALAWRIHRDTEVDSLRLKLADRTAFYTKMMKETQAKIVQSSEAAREMEREITELKQERADLVAAVERLEGDLAAALSRLSRKRERTVAS